MKRTLSISRLAAGAGSLPPRARARRLRHRLCRQYRGPKVARHRPEGHPDSDQPDPSRRLRLRSADRRRRGHPDPDSARVFRARMRSAGLYAAGAGRVRRGHGVSAGRSAGAAALRRHPRKDRARRRAARARLARHADQRQHDRAPGARLRSPTSSRFSSAARRAWIRTRSSASCTWCASARKRQSRNPT